MTTKLPSTKLIIELLVFTVAVACGPQLSKKTYSGNGIDVPGYKKTELLAQEDFSENLQDWLLEGKVNASIDKGRLFFVSTDSLVKNPKGNIWWKHNFKSPYLLEFDYQSTTENGLSMLFWNALTLDGSEIVSNQRTGKYEEYVNGDMQAYHFSFHRFGTGVSNLRKAPGFHLLASVDDPIKPLDTAVHKIHIASTGKRQRIFVDYRLILDFTDKGEPCITQEKWQHPLPCKGTGKIPEKGAFGIRHTQKQGAYYDNFKVYRLETE